MGTSQEQRSPAPHGRRGRALIAAAFTYIQWFLGAAVALFVTRFLIRSLGNDLYGLWLATGALLAYAALADLGVLGVLPWLIAEADGEKNEAKMLSIVSHGAAASIVGGVLYGVAALSLLALLPGLVHLSAEDYAKLRGPILALAIFTAVGFPARIFAAIRTGLQDFRFTGIVGTAQTVASGVIVVALTRAGFGLYGVALGACIPPLAGASVLAWRTMQQEPWLLRSWPRWTWTALRPIVSSGLGNWIATLGWSLMAASDTVIIGYLGHRELAPMFVVTGRLGLTLMQMGWVLPDSTAVGLAQLNAEGARERVRDVVIALIRFHLLFSGAIACGTLAVNVGFVKAWVGLDLYGGARLNAMFALDVVLLSVGHAFIAPVAILGQRGKAGLVTIANGVVHIGLAIVLGRALGLIGIAAATAISFIVTSLPISAVMLARMTDLQIMTMTRTLLLPWALRIVPCALVAMMVGWVCMRASLAATTLGERIGPLLVSFVGGGGLTLIYLFGMRSIVRDLPFGPRLRRVLVAVRLV